MPLYGIRLLPTDTIEPSSLSENYSHKALQVILRFIKTESSLPYPQEPAISPHFKSNESSP
jgi:hypothetical protein